MNIRLSIAGLLGFCFLWLGPACQSVADAPPALRILSYNIKHGLGMDGELDLERIAKVVAAEHPDVVLLQEVDERCGRSGSVDQAAWLGERLGMQARFAPFMDYDGGRYGLAVLSKHPIVEERIIPLPPGQHEPRSALQITIQVGPKRLQIANAHLDWLAEDTQRWAQAQRLRVELTAPWDSPNLGIVPPLILGGDLNDVPNSRVLAGFLSPGQNGRPHFRWLGPKAFTFPSDAPARTIDHFLVCPANAYPGSQVKVLAEPVASDHCPVLLELSL